MTTAPGAPAYMSPQMFTNNYTNKGINKTYQTSEIINNNKQIINTGDVWQFGILVCQMILHEIPYDQMNKQQEEEFISEQIAQMNPKQQQGNMHCLVTIFCKSNQPYSQQHRNGITFER